MIGSGDGLRGAAGSATLWGTTTGTVVMSDQYEDDIVLWADRQATLLRRHAATARPNADAPDWPNIIEEIESVGREQLHAVQSLLMRAMVHHLKAQAWPASREVPHWLAEARLFQADAADRFVPSMRQRIDLDRAYRLALRGLPDTIDGVPPGPVPDTCPFTLDGLLGIG